MTKVESTITRPMIILIGMRVIAPTKNLDFFHNLTSIRRKAGYFESTSSVLLIRGASYFQAQFNINAPIAALTIRPITINVKLTI